MGALANSVALQQNGDWRNWMTAAASTVARQVYSEPTSTNQYQIRRRLAIDVLSSPDMLSTQLATLLAADTTLTIQGDTPEELPEDEITNRVAALWTPLAKQQYSDSMT